MKFTYLLIDGFSVVIPVVFSFHPKIRFYENFKAFFAANTISAICFIFWDAVFTAKGIWGFNEKYIMGAHFVNLPVEEILFFFCIPFACVFTDHCLNRIFTKQPNSNKEKSLTGSLILLLFIGGTYFKENAYTAITFISTAALLFLCTYVLHINWAGRAYRTYAVLLLPFLIVNGLLTGSGLAEPIVWYNDQETMRFRIFSIPLEDVFFGFELFFLTRLFYELFLIRIKNKVYKKRQDKYLRQNSDE